MYVRLAFAVAAHLDTEVLLVDEVLAVGDEQFQNKCLGKIQTVGREGRTVVFVSHNMGAIASLCNETVFLNRGTCIDKGETEKIISAYLRRGITSTGEVSDGSSEPLDQKLKLRRLRLMNGLGDPQAQFDLRDEVNLEIEFEVLIGGRGYNVGFEVYSARNGCVFSSSLMDSDPPKALSRYFEVGDYVARIELPTQIMRGGEYWIKGLSAIPNVEILDVMKQDLCFTLLDVSSPVAKTSEGRLGCVLPILSWSLETPVWLSS